MRRYLDTALRYRWVIAFVLALTWIPGVALAYVEYMTSYEADATIWTQRTSQQFASVSPQDPSLTTFVTPASEQAGVLMQLLQTRNFLSQIVARASLRLPDSAADQKKFYEEFSKRFRVEVLGSNLFRLSYRARDPRTGPQVVLAALAERQKHLTASREAANDAAASYYRSEMQIAQNYVLNAQRELDNFEAARKPPLSASDEYEQRQLRLTLEEAKARVGDIKARIDRSGVLPGILQMADSLDFQVVDRPLEDGKPTGGLRPAAMIGGSAFLAGLVLAAALVLGGTLLATRLGAEPVTGHLPAAPPFATVPEVARGRSSHGRELRTALARVAFAPGQREAAGRER